MGEEGGHKDPVRDKVGVYYKTSDYRDQCEGCGRGHHGHRWEAHHVLPGCVFSSLDPFISECLGVTDYDINRPYSMAGLPNLNAYILFFQEDPEIPFEHDREQIVQMLRWGDLVPFKYQENLPVSFPGDWPCHNPVSFGHVIYNEKVDKYLTDKIWNPLKKKKRKNQHMKPEDVKQKLLDAQKHFWDDLKARGSGEGGGGCRGVRENLKHRYGKARSGWWKPLCMADVHSAPVSPSLV